MVPDSCLDIYEEKKTSMDEIQYNTPCVIKLGSFAGKVRFF